ncbi:maleylacetoacetate isomerase [Sphingobium lactosutens]|uniref:maleylacetoacetate isomerase n=1 Tax=Sphingobium lactosutens TaxID=522773 RepID=UPI0015BC4FDB|nr:maleylacetoacetate isomerase [Sphingobium lactosutens]NWK94599.1 maleylacetoacetate isomerase [Sphingobium lactosutens]
MTEPILHGYFRSTASYRVRIVLNLKGIAYTDAFHHLRKGEQRAPDYLALNPQGLVPALDMQGTVLTQSLAICEYLDELVDEPKLLPEDMVRRAKVRAAALLIACDIHPIQNLRILDRLRDLGLAEEQVADWARQVIDEGLEAFDRLIAEEDGPYCFGDQVTLADVFLVAQLVNARRFGVDLRWPRLVAVERSCLALEAFSRAAPQNQQDAE